METPAFQGGSEGSARRDASAEDWLLCSRRPAGRPPRSRKEGNCDPAVPQRVVLGAVAGGTRRRGARGRPRTLHAPLEAAVAPLLVDTV
jgi:hypothetical protein